MADQVAQYNGNVAQQVAVPAPAAILPQGTTQFQSTYDSSAQAKVLQVRSGLLHHRDFWHAPRHPMKGAILSSSRNSIGNMHLKHPVTNILWHFQHRLRVSKGHMGM